MQDWMTFAYVAGAVALGAVVTGLALRSVLTRRARALRDAARLEAQALVRAAEFEAEAFAGERESEAREQGLEARDRAGQELSARFDQVSLREERLVAREAGAEEDAARAKEREVEVAGREREAQSRGDLAKNTQREIERTAVAIRAALEARAGATAEELRTQLTEAWVEEARAEAAQRVRAVDQGASDPEYIRSAKRIMGIAVQRYQGHYLTERLLSNVPVPPGFADYLAQDDSAMLHAVEQGSGVKLELSENGEKIRIDSGDGVAREVARRALAKLIKGTAPRGVEREPKKWMEQLAQNVDREIVDLGKKAFSELELPKAHPDIVKLVGRLNYRTSYTQNQWKHALEAAFLGGMMAAELGLDVKLARRATLLHDIGKSLSHEIEGSHAVIGADYARRLGETEIVANAIGAHHADEPPRSIYAFLVAAADAMSGARPGARREQTEQYSTRLDDLARIGGSFRGVDCAFGVQGGREVRVYVREKDVDDARAVELSSLIAKKISDEMTFPGQIKVTVIRQVEAVEIAS